LYDAIGTLAETTGNSLNQKKYIDLIMPPLISKWNQLPDTDANLFPLLECLSFVATALGPGFLPFATPVFERSIRLIHGTLAAQAAFEQNPQQLEPPEKDFIVVALDLLSGLIQGIGTSAESLINNIQPNLVELLKFCVKVCYGCDACFFNQVISRIRSPMFVKVHSHSLVIWLATVFCISNRISRYSCRFLSSSWITPGTSS
jgi:hypothetical protein